jgi:ribokinase
MTELTVAVVGSVNLDIVARVDRFPVPGETMTNAVVKRFPGGKGANQAMAAHRLGAQVTMLACLGKDAMAAEALAGLSEEGVNLDSCQYLHGYSTGLAMILVSKDGENQIVVAPGANAAFQPDLLNLPETDLVMAQLELPMETVLRAAKESKGFFCLNAAPAKAVPQAVLDHTDLLVVNEIEAHTLGSGLEHFTGWLATTYGAEGAILTKNGEEVARMKPPRIEAVDTTGAGDAFTAALAVSMAQGIAPELALRRACFAGAITATRQGAQSSPSMKELLQAESEA